ncbi:hypothetical protein EJB05_15136, partial [Eragrostis curvula]
RPGPSTHRRSCTTAASEVAPPSLLHSRRPGPPSPSSPLPPSSPGREVGGNSSFKLEYASARHWMQRAVQYSSALNYSPMASWYISTLNLSMWSARKQMATDRLPSPFALGRTHARPSLAIPQGPAPPKVRVADGQANPAGDHKGCTRTSPPGAARFLIGGPAAGPGSPAPNGSNRRPSCPAPTG